MKKAIAILSIAVACLFAPACNSDRTSNARADKKNVILESEVPVAVKNSFNASHAAATEIIWESAHEEGIGTYKVKFKANDKYMKAEYKGDGTLIKENDDKQ